jgi:hypothetical protein
MGADMLTKLAIVFCVTVGQGIWSHAAAATKLEPASLIGLTIETSRPRISAGGSLGVIAEITNRSDKTVYLQELYLTLKVPPELEGPWAGPQAWYAYFPTFDHRQVPGGSAAITLALKPGDSYKAVWYRTPDAEARERHLEAARAKRAEEDKKKLDAGAQAKPTTGVVDDRDERLVQYVFRTIVTELNFLFFVPGDYTLTVVGLYWTDPGFPLDQYRTISQSVTLPVTAPQSVILLGAAVGGIIAYFILPQARRRWIASRSRNAAVSRSLRARARRWWQEVGGVVGAAVLSMIVTILLARISETQFLIRVTVSDVWGAIAIGFVANYVGAGLLAKLIPHRTEPDGPAEIKRAEPRAGSDPRSDAAPQPEVRSRAEASRRSPAEPGG